jgi:SAM-dependent methyltransferase
MGEGNTKTVQGSPPSETAAIEGDCGRLLALLRRRPAPYEATAAAFWDDPHVSVGMLKAHLDPHLRGATREHAFVDRSVAWIAAHLPPGRYERLLDLGCGPGLYAQRFCARGYRVVGVDFARRSIAYARESAARHGMAIDYRLMDYRRLCDEGAYDLATLIYCDYGAMPPADRRRVLQNVHRALVPGGALLLDAFTRREYRNKPERTNITTLEEGFWHDGPHALIHSFCRYDDEAVYLDRYIVLTEGGMANHNVWNCAFDPASLGSELEAAGFSDVEYYNDVAGAPYSKNGRTLCAIARKPR